MLEGKGPVNPRALGFKTFFSLFPKFFFFPVKTSRWRKKRGKKTLKVKITFWFWFLVFLSERLKPPFTPPKKPAPQKGKNLITSLEGG